MNGDGYRPAPGPANPKPPQNSTGSGTRLVVAQVVPPTPGPLVVGYYVPSPSFLGVREHIAVMRRTGALVAVTGSSDNERTSESIADARLYAAAPDGLLAAKALIAEMRLLVAHGLPSVPSIGAFEALVAFVVKAEGGA